MKTAFLFPGQGSQRPGIIKELPVNDPIVSSVVLEVENILSKKISALDNAKSLNSTVNVQLCLLIAGVISARRLLDQGVMANFVAGHSVGAFAAAVISRVISFEQAVNLVHTRSKMMEETFPENYGMAAITGFTPSRLQPYLLRHNDSHPHIYISNINSANQIVIAGDLGSLAILIAELENSGIQKVKLLDVNVPSHCKLMSGISDGLKKEIAQIDLKTPVIPYLSNVRGRLLTTGESIGRDLWQSISSPVMWYDGTTLMYEKGVRVFIEMEPAGVLSKLAATTFPEAVILNSSERQIIEIARMWNNYQQENK